MSHCLSETPPQKPSSTRETPNAGFGFPRCRKKLKDRIGLRNRACARSVCGRWAPCGRSGMARGGTVQPSPKRMKNHGPRRPVSRRSASMTRRCGAGAPRPRPACACLPIATAAAHGGAARLSAATAADHGGHARLDRGTCRPPVPNRHRINSPLVSKQKLGKEPNRLTNCQRSAANADPAAPMRP